MGLTVIAFLLVPVFGALFAFARAKARGTGAGRILEAMSILLVIFSAAQGLSYLFAGSANVEFVPMTLERISGAILLLVHVLIVALALEFPEPLPFALRIVIMSAMLVAVLVADYFIITTYDYVASVIKTGDSLLRLEGRLSINIVPVQAAVAAATGLVFALRSIFAKSLIQRQRSAVAAVGVLAGASLIWVVAGGLPSYSGLRPAFALTPLGCLIMLAAVSYAVGLTRVFDWAAIGRLLASYAVLAIVVGLPAGIALVFLMHLGTTYPLAPALGGAVLFIAAWFLVSRFGSRFLERVLLRSHYREDLQRELAGIDLASGRDHLLGELHRLLSKALDFTEFSVLIEDERGILRSVYSSTGAATTIDPKTALAQVLGLSGATVVLKSEVLANAAFAEARKELLQLFDMLRAEALLVVREGSRVIGLFVLGARVTGAGYTGYDYETFRAIYGKLFVFAYYLMNVSKESILDTFDREVALTDQVVRYALTKMDPLDKARCDAAWSMQSVHRIGGDFVDFIRLAPDRWLIVVGDVSGTGLSASMSMLVLKSMVRTFVRIERNLTGLVSRLNSFIKDNLPKGTFFSGLIGSLDLAKGTLTYVNCGLPTLLIHEKGSLSFLEAREKGKVLGFVKDIAPHLASSRIELPAGSTLVAVTRGLEESRNRGGEPYGPQRLRRAVKQRIDLPATEIVEGVVGELLAFSDRRVEDDITLLVMKFATGPSQEPSASG